MDERTRRMESWRSDETPTDELETVGPPPATRAMPVQDGGSAAWHGGPSTADDAPTTRFEPVAQPVAAPPRHVPQASSPPPPPAPQPIAHHPVPSPAPFPVQATGGVAPRPVGPNVLARVASLLLVPPLLAVGAVGISLAIVQLVSAAAARILGADLMSLPWDAWGGAVLAVGAIAFLLAGLASRLSGLGTGAGGLVLTVFGVLAVAWPGVFLGPAGALVGQSDPSGLPDSAQAVITGGTAIVGAIVLAIGVLALGAAVAVHGTRGAGWERGRGR